MRRSPSLWVLPLVVLFTGCAEPPHKEMNQAQGAIDAARAAGAEQYAPEELSAAAAALAQSEQAVTQKDYRLALNLAIDSRNRAQEAAKTAVDNRAKARGDAERVLAETQAALNQARTRLAGPSVAKTPRRTLAEATAAIEATEKTLQEARTALESNEYGRAVELAEGVAVRISEVLATLEPPATPAGPGRRR